MTMTLISTLTVGAGGAANIDFTGIPQTYKDLLVRISARESATSNWVCTINFNDSSTTYSGKHLQGDGSSVAAFSEGSSSGQYNVSASSSTANTFGNVDVYIPNYTVAINKSFSMDGVSENNAITAYSRITGDLWATTAAITKISITGNVKAQYSTVSLYGISTSGATGAVVA